MDEDLLNFNYPLQPKNQIYTENKIKHHLKTIALDTVGITEIERYSDKYAGNVLRHDVLKTINPEILSNELQKYFGMNLNNDGNIIMNDLDLEEEQNNSAENNLEDNSLSGGDDYENNYFDEDELVDENKYNEEIF